VIFDQQFKTVIFAFQYQLNVDWGVAWGLLVALGFEYSRLGMMGTEYCITWQCVGSLGK